MNRLLQTARLLLRPPETADAPIAHDRWARDPEVLRYLGFTPHADLAQTRRQLDWDAARWLKRSAWTWLLVPQADGSGPVGLIQLLPQRLDAPAHHLRLGFLIARSHQRQGLMREAVEAVCAHALAEPGVWRVDALCDVENLASRALLQATGFRCEGRLGRHTLHPNVSAEPRDVWLYARLRDEPAPAARRDAGAAG